jgi:hypothetical protein
LKQAVLWFAVFSCLPCCPVLTAQSDASVPILIGYQTAPPAASRLTIDGRPVHYSSATGFICGNTDGLLGTEGGVPHFVSGSMLGVYGKWSRKTQQYEAASVCVLRVPSSEVSGSAVIDSVLSSSAKIDIVADGRLLRLPAKRGTLLSASGDAPTPGEWLDYKAKRQKDGTFLLTGMKIHPAPYGPDEKHPWKPVLFIEPTPQRAGLFKMAHLQRPWTLPNDPQALERIRRVGGSVVPAWQKALPAGAPDGWQFAFYLVKGKHLSGGDCLSFPDGLILVPSKTESLLKDDGQLAALLAGCVAEVTEEQVLRISPGATASAATEIGSLAAPAVLGLPMLVGSFAYGEHEQTMMRDQSARVALVYTAAAGYPIADGAAAWETLKSKHGQMRLNSQPPDRADIAYKMETQAAPAAAAAAGAP